MRKVHGNRNLKQGGFLVTAELILISTILVIGLIVGLATIRDAVNQELEDLALGIGSLNQSLSVQGVVDVDNTNFTAGAGFSDSIDAHDPDSVNFTTGSSEF